MGGYNHEQQPVVDPMIAVQKDLYAPENINVMGMLVSPCIIAVPAAPYLIAVYLVYLQIVL